MIPTALHPLGRRRPPLPYDSLVEYVESTGAQYVDTGLAINTATDEVRAAFQLVGTNHYRYLFGVMQTGAFLGVGRGNSSTYLLYASGDANRALSYITGRQHHIVSDSNGLGIDGDTLLPFAAFASTASIHLFSLHRPGSPNNYKSASRCYGYRVIRNGTTVIDLDPVRVGTAGALYDRVAGTLLYSATSTPLLPGPDLP